MTEQLREKIAKVIRDKPYKCQVCEQIGNCAECLADQILALIKEAGFVGLDPDQSLPDIPLLTTRHDDPGYLDGWIRNASEKTQQDMLKAGWRKVIM